MKITHVIDSGGYYGAEIFLTNLCKCQMDMGLKVDVVSIGKPNQEKKVIEKKLEAMNIPYTAWRMRPFPDPRESHKLIRFFKENNTSIVHSHGYKGNILLGLLPKKRRNIPVITTIHGYTLSSPFTKLRIYHHIDRFLIQYLDAVVLVSDAMKHQVDERKIGEKLLIIENGIPSEIPACASEKLDLLKKERFNISAIGRLSLEKNFQLLISAMPSVIQEIPEAKLTIFGEGALRKNLEALIRDLDLSEYIVLAGFIDEPSKIYRHSDLIVNCSITEGMPISLLEAMREGCPFIASEISANTKLTDSAKIQKQIFSLNKESLANKIIEFYRSTTEEKAELRNKMKSTFSCKYTIEISAIAYLNLYQLLIDQNNTKASFI